MKIAGIKPIIDSMFTAVENCEYAWYEVRGIKFYFREFAYKAKAEELVAQALFLEITAYLQDVACSWGEPLVRFNTSGIACRVSPTYGLNNYRLIWRVEPELRRTDDGVSGYARLQVVWNRA